VENAEGLKKGMSVRNVRSGNIAELMGRAPDKPEEIGFWCYDVYLVPIRRRSSSGKWRYDLWSLQNLELA
jgi:hypothetical protein